MLQPPVFAASPGTVAGMGDKSPLDFFRLLFDEDIMRLLHTETLRYAEQYMVREKDHLQEHPQARAHMWRRSPLLPKELDVFLALLIAMGICGLPTLR